MYMLMGGESEYAIPITEGVIEGQTKIGITSTEVEKEEEKKQIIINTSHDDFIGKNYTDIINTLKSLGFFNIKER